MFSVEKPAAPFYNIVSASKASDFDKQQQRQFVYKGGHINWHDLRGCRLSVKLLFFSQSDSSQHELSADTSSACARRYGGPLSTDVSLNLFFDLLQTLFSVASENQGRNHT